jgi:hypothetical protein
MGADVTGAAGMGPEMSLAPHSAEGLQAPLTVTLAASSGTLKGTHVVIPLEYASYPGATGPSLLPPLESDEGCVGCENWPVSKSQAHSSSHAGGAARSLGFRTC